MTKPKATARLQKPVKKKPEKSAEDKQQFDDALKRVWNLPPQHRVAKKKEQKKK